jgi:uncharacterized protein
MEKIYRLLLALIIGTGGGLLFSYLHLPLPWMLGPMTACAIASMFRVPVAAHARIRPPMTVVIGILLGTRFKWDAFTHLGEWLVPLLVLPVFLCLCTLTCMFYFRRVGKFSPATAYFCGVPGGLVEMVIIGGSNGADERTVALVHAARIFLVVMALPFLIRAILVADQAPMPSSVAPLLLSGYDDIVWMVFAGIAGSLLGYFLKLPGGYLIGPMIVSALLHLLSISDFDPPTVAVNIAQVVLGTTVGCRFAAASPREILHILVLSIGATALLLLITVTFGIILSKLAYVSMVQIILAYSPGGFTEMSLIALALKIEVAFVVVHHVFRVFIVLLGASPLFGLLKRVSTGKS